MRLSLIGGEYLLTLAGLVNGMKAAIGKGGEGSKELDVIFHFAIAAAGRTSDSRPRVRIARQNLNIWRKRVRVERTGDRIPAARRF